MLNAKKYSSRKVHISATTLSFLNGEFEVEAAYGEKREESLRIAGLKTYYIVKVLKPVSVNLFKTAFLTFQIPKKVFDHPLFRNFTL